MAHQTSEPAHPPSPAAGTHPGTEALDARDEAAAGMQHSAAMVHGYDYLARIWLDGPLRPAEAALQAWLPGLMPLDAGLARRWADLIRLLDLPDERAAADEDYQSCLVIPQPGRYVPPYASVWLDGAEGLWGPTTARVLACYQEAGLDWTTTSSSGHGRSWVRAPDHLGVECAFAAELAAGQAGAGPPQGAAEAAAADPAAVAAGFIAGHLRRWVPAYAGQLARHVRSRYWRGMSGVVAEWVELDARSG